MVARLKRIRLTTGVIFRLRRPSPHHPASFSMLDYRTYATAVNNCRLNFWTKTRMSPLLY